MGGRFLKNNKGKRTPLLYQKKINKGLNMIHISCSKVKSQKTKSVSTGFQYTVYKNLDDLAKAMMKYAHSPSVYSTMIRYDPYSKSMKRQNRRRLHNISFVGNVLAYDFDDGSLTFKKAKKLAKKFNLPTLIIRSKSDPKYDYDRFKMMIVTNLLYPIYQKDREMPEGYEGVMFGNYSTIYENFAKKYDFYQYMDKSTKDASRLIAQVTTADEEDTRREYVIISK